MVTKWIEVNIHLKQYNLSVLVLYEFIAPLIKRLLETYKVNSWHFFFEPELRLRFLVDKSVIKEIRKELDKALFNFEMNQPSLFDKHIFGAHGKIGKDYDGEVDMYGACWHGQYNVWNANAYLALSLSNPLNSKKTVEFHARRISHLSLNQLGYTRLQEVFFHLKFAFRHLRIWLIGNE